MALRVTLEGRLEGVTNSGGRADIIIFSDRLYRYSIYESKRNLTFCFIISFGNAVCHKLQHRFGIEKPQFKAFGSFLSPCKLVALSLKLADLLLQSLQFVFGLFVTNQSTAHKIYDTCAFTQLSGKHGIQRCNVIIKIVLILLAGKHRVPNFVENRGGVADERSAVFPNFLIQDIRTNSFLK